MAQLGQTFETESLPRGSNNYEPLPSGWYSASITQAELRATKDGNGQYIRLRYDITGPSHQGRVVFGNLNVKNSSVKAEEIGRQQLGDLMRAIGLAKVADTDELIGGTLSIKLDVRPAENGYAAQNEVKGYKSLGGGSATFAPPPQAAPSGEKAKAAPPWAKK
jgi:hypothetical protein